MTVRNVKKNLAGQQDLLPGVGPYEQIRRGQAVTVDGLAKSYFELWIRSYAEVGLPVKGTFEDGVTLTAADDVAVHLVGGVAYSWDGSFPKVVPAGSTPETTGGVIAGAWRPRTDVTLREELSDATGPNLIGFDPDAEYEADTIGDALSDAVAAVDVLGGTQDLVFRKSIQLVLPFRFPDYDAAFAFVGSPSYIYPQGHCYDANGNVYIKYARGTLSVIVWYTKTGVYGGYFYIQPGGESLVINVTGSGIKTLYSKGGSNRLYSYNINTMPASGAVVPHTDLGLSSIGLQYAYEKGRWIIEQIGPDVGAEGSRTKWNIYDGAFNKTGEFYVPKTIVGWQLPDSPLYNYVPKTQGVCLRGGRVVLGLGGSYDPANDGPVSKPVAAVGIADMSLDGTLLAYGTLKASKLITRLSNDGYQIVRTESEGVTLRPDGSVSHLIISANPTTAGNTEFGILLFTEQDVEGVDYSFSAEPYVPFDFARTHSGVFPRGVDGLLHNPLTDAVMSTMDQLIQYIREVQAPRIAWYTSAVTITPLPGISLPTAMYVEIRNANNLTFMVSVTGAGGNKNEYSVNYNESTFVYTVTKLGVEAALVKVGTGGGGPDVVGRILYPHKDAGEEDVQAMSVSSTSANNSLIIGGGSSLFNAATIIDFHTASDRTTLTGVHRLRIDSAGNVRPGADNAQPLGLSSVRWSVVYAGTGTINTSDAREKTSSLSIDDVLLDVADDISVDMWKWLNAIAEKGEDSARWHFGPIAQQVRDAFAKHGRDGCDYGLLCYDKWDDQFEDEVAIRENDDGQTEEYLTGRRILVIPAGDRWGIRTDQCLWLLAAASRRRVQRAEDRLSAIEAKLAAAGW